MTFAALPSTLLLDLDDTIVSFSVGTANLWRDTLQEHAHQLGGVDATALAEVVQQVITPAYWGEPKRAVWGRMNMHEARRQVLQQALDHMAHEALPEAVRVAADAFTDAKEEAVAPLEDAVDVLRELRRRGRRLGLITNGNSNFQRRKLKRYDLEQYFDTILVEEEWGVGKPDPSIFEQALRTLGIAPQDTWMVGDNFEADIVGAHRVGIAGVWMHHGRSLPKHSEVTPFASIDHIRRLLDAEWSSDHYPN
jgi:putative hydrolase of the HAD superfamily